MHVPWNCPSSNTRWRMLKPCSIETWKFLHQSGASSIIILFTLPLLMVSNEPSKIPVDGEREGDRRREKKKEKRKADKRVHRLQHSQTHIQRTSRKANHHSQQQTNKKKTYRFQIPRRQSWASCISAAPPHHHRYSHHWLLTGPCLVVQPARHSVLDTSCTLWTTTFQLGHNSQTEWIWSQLFLFLNSLQSSRHFF